MKFKRKISLLLILVTLTIAIFNGCNKQNATTKSRDKKNSTIQQLDSTTQQILDNDKFLKSEEGQGFQISAWKFAKAFLDGDIEYIKNNLVSNKNYDEIYSYENKFSELESMTFRFNNFESKSKIANADYVLLFNENIDDSNIYLEFSMKLDNGKWKIVDYATEK